MFTLTIETDNAAFTDDAAREVARILRQLAKKLEDGKDSGKVMDLNGNSVGSFELSAT